MARHIIEAASLPPLPADIAEDLQDAFNFYDKEKSGFIGVAQFKNILHNMGFHNMSKKEIDEELKRHQIDLNKRQTFDMEIVKRVVSYRLIKAKGIEDEAKECFKIIDQRDKTYITSHDLINSLKQALDFPVTEQDITEFMEIAGADNGHLYLNSFMKLYTS